METEQKMEEVAARLMLLSELDMYAAIYRALEYYSTVPHQIYYYLGFAYGRALQQEEKRDG